MTGTIAVDIMSRLRDETHTEHTLAETSDFERNLVAGRIPRQAYVSYLQQRHTIHSALDRAVGDLCDADARLDGLIPPELFQVENLEADLRHLDASAAAPLGPTGDFVNWIESRSRVSDVALLGAYYVFEGSKNGARFIARGVARPLGLTPPHGLRYLDPHGDAQRGLWKAFKERMNAVAFANAERDVMVDGAKRAFAAVRAVDHAIWMGISQ